MCLSYFTTNTYISTTSYRTNRIGSILYVTVVFIESYICFISKRVEKLNHAGSEESEEKRHHHRGKSIIHRTGPDTA